MDVTVVRMTIEDMKHVQEVPDGELVYFDAIQHFYIEALEHGMSLREAIELLNKTAGKW